MKSEKLSLTGIKNMLSRAELKRIMAGSAGGGPTCTQCVNGIATCCQCIFSNGPSGVYFLSNPDSCEESCIALNYYGGIVGNPCIRCGC